MECIILAGGLGTRLRSVIGNQPKCMALINGKPFLHYLFDYLQEQGCRRLILSLGHGHEAVTQWLHTQQERPFAIAYVTEQEPLGTGGGIRLALEQATSNQVVVLNGDTMFRISLRELLRSHTDIQAETTLALKPMIRYERYGTVRINKQNIITAFEEKKYQEDGLINGGVYCLNRSRFFHRQLSQKFSFEKDYLETFVQEGILSGHISDSYFIDIGIPEDYERAKKEFPVL